MRMCLTGLCSIALLLLLAAPASAQETVDEILSFLLTNRAVPTGDAAQDREAAEAARDTLSRALLGTLATVPISSSSGGFAYRLNPSLGTVERVSRSFGPFFVERALTAGREQGSLGFSFRYTRYDRLDGTSLGDGTFMTTANKFADEATPFDVETLSLSIETTTATVFGNFGVTDRLDVGVAVPFVRMTIEGERINLFRGQPFLQARAAASVSGLADLAVRAKYALISSGASGLAAAADLRLPTGRKEDLLGAGRPGVELAIIGSAESGATAAHANVGYAFGGLSREVSYAGALTVAATDRVTVVGEFVGRRLEGVGRITPIATAHPRLRGVETVRLMPVGDSAQVVFALAGLKWNVAGAWLLYANVMFPLTDAGLSARAMPAFALDYAF